MASSSSSSLLVLVISITLFISLFSPVSAVTCATQKLSKNRSYTNCTDLPTFNAILHHTYTATNRSLSIAFSTDSPTSDGWVGWGINPTAKKMFGSGAFIATKFNGTTNVNTYNLISQKVPYKQENLSFKVWDLSTEDIAGVITIFAKLELPEKAENLSQIWQVGPVDGGEIKKHAFENVNLGSTAALQVVATAVAPSGSESGDNQHKSGGVKMMKSGKSGVGFYFGVVLVLVGFMMRM